MNLHRRCFASPDVVVPLLAALLALLALSCSGGPGSGGSTAPPTTPDDYSRLGVEGRPFQNGHNLVGFCTVFFDPASGTAEVRANRSVEVHLNLTSFLTHANCPGGNCLTWHITGFEPAKRIWHVDMVLVNPTPWSVYDLRIIFEGLPGDPEEGTAWLVANPDSYTNIWDSDDEWDEEEQWLNPFIAFEKQDIERKFRPDPDGGGSEIYSDTEELLMYIPPGAPGGAIDLIVDASFPNHCKEPYEITHIRQSDDLPVNYPDSAVYFECVVADWQKDILDVSVYIEDVISEDTDDLLQMEMWPIQGEKAWPPLFIPPPWDDETQQKIADFLLEFGGYDYMTLRKYYANITNELEATTGIYPAIIVAQSVDLDGDGNDTLYNVFPFEVDIGGPIEPDKKPQIAFSSYRDGDADIFTHYMANGENYKLTDDLDTESNELEVCMHHNQLLGTKLVFASNYDPILGTDDFELYYIDDLPYSGGAPVTVPANQWSRLTDNSWDDRMPDFSFDGTHVAFVSEPNGQWDIYDLDLSSFPTLPAPDRVTMNFAGDEAPSYNKNDPTNHSLFFMSNRSGGSNYEIYEIDPTEAESSGNLPIRWTFHAGFEGYPSSRGQGGWGFAFTSGENEKAEIITFDGAEFAQLTDDNNWDSYPSFSPDGKWIAFQSLRNDNFDLYQMSWLGENITRITNHDDPDLDPFYSGAP